MLSHVQTKTEIRAVLDSLGVRPQKRFGQHFLIDGNLMRRLALAAEITPADTVLEVGPGTGGLTDLLAAAAGNVVAVEIDRALAAFLRERYADRPHVRILQTDVLAGKNHLSPLVLAALQEVPITPRAAGFSPRGAAAEDREGRPPTAPDSLAGGAGRVLLVANLPYNVATPLLTNLLHELPCVSRMGFTIQRDVADRITAGPGTKAYGPLSITMQAAARVQTLARIPPAAFWPPPQVDSTMLRVDVRPQPPLDDAARIARFSRFVRDAFLHRRKTLRYNLTQCLGEAALLVAADAFDLSRRPEELSVSEWTELARRTVLAE